ncbi:MAG: hypothetical protein QG573_1282, partial [Acidobacteriota bacterium]|nr:hypothetical protein [Acidobacteriota bacterium]
GENHNGENAEQGEKREPGGRAEGDVAHLHNLSDASPLA